MEVVVHPELCREAIHRDMIRIWQEVHPVMLDYVKVHHVTILLEITKSVLGKEVPPVQDLLLEMFIQVPTIVQDQGGHLQDLCRGEEQDHAQWILQGAEIGHLLGNQFILKDQ